MNTQEFTAWTCGLDYPASCEYRDELIVKNLKSCRLGECCKYAREVKITVLWEYLPPCLPDSPTAEYNDKSPNNDPATET